MHAIDSIAAQPVQVGSGHRAWPPPDLGQDDGPTVGIEDVCAAHGMPLAALQFPLAHPQVASVIPGMGSPEQVAEAVRLIALPIPPLLRTDLRAAGLIRADAPIPSSIAKEQS